MPLLWVGSMPALIQIHEYSSSNGGVCAQAPVLKSRGTLAGQQWRPGTGRGAVVVVPASVSPDSGSALVGSTAPAGMPKKASPGGGASCCSPAGAGAAALLCSTCLAGSVPDKPWPTSAGSFLLIASASAEGQHLGKRTAGLQALGCNMCPILSTDAGYFTSRQKAKDSTHCHVNRACEDGVE